MPSSCRLSALPSAFSLGWYVILSLPSFLRFSLLPLLVLPVLLVRSFFHTPNHTLLFYKQGIPLSAFTTECGPSSALPSLNGTDISSSSTITPFASIRSSTSSDTDASLCVQLDGGFCLQNCSISNNFIRGGGMYGLIVFSCLLQCVCLMFWAKFQEEILSAHDQTPSRRGSVATTPPVTEASPVLPVLYS